MSAEKLNINSDLAYSLFDGGWRDTDKDYLQEEYKLTEEETDNLCYMLEEIENKRCEYNIHYVKEELINYLKEHNTLENIYITVIPEVETEFDFTWDTEELPQAPNRFKLDLYFLEGIYNYYCSEKGRVNHEIEDDEYFYEMGYYIFQTIQDIKWFFTHPEKDENKKGDIQ